MSSGNRKRKPFCSESSLECCNIVVFVFATTPLCLLTRFLGLQPMVCHWVCFTSSFTEHCRAAITVQKANLTKDSIMRSKAFCSRYTKKNLNLDSDAQKCHPYLITCTNNQCVVRRRKYLCVKIFENNKTADCHIHPLAISVAIGSRGAAEYPSWRRGVDYSLDRSIVHQSTNRDKY